MSKFIKLCSQNCNRYSIKKYIRFERELLDAINDSRSDTESFSAWVKGACRDKLNCGEPICSEPHAELTINTDLTMSDSALVIQMHEEGLFNQQIADALNERGIKPQSGTKKWTRAGVSKILKASLYSKNDMKN